MMEKNQRISPREVFEQDLAIDVLEKRGNWRDLTAGWAKEDWASLELMPNTDWMSDEQVKNLFIPSWEKVGK